MTPAGEGYHTLRMQNIQEEIPGFKTITFADGHGIDYKAGQYLTFVRYLAGKEIRRSYSITSSPDMGEPLAIGVKRVENGIFSRYLVDAAKQGSEVLCTGSAGVFTLPDDVDAYQQVFFFAAGSGITPIYALLKTVLYAHPLLKVVLIYSNASVQSTIYLAQLQRLQQLYPQRLRIELLYSNNEQLLRARLHRDLIFEYLAELAVADKTKVLFYICGPENYMRLCTYTITEDGFSANNVRREIFVINALPKAILLPPDKDTHTVHIHSKNTTKQITVQYPDAILKAARKEGINLPYSCETGRCGSCIARCTRGEVWHAYNEVLTDADLQKGLILTCVAHPINSDVWLEV